jgi:Ferric reductase NAD binding domain
VETFTTQLAAKLLAVPRPIAILDGLYSVGNHAVRAMTHDHILIVAGGVDITPFLSLTPNLLGRLQAVEEDGASSTNKIVLHWACREESLLQYVRDTYLYPMMVQARLVPGVKFEVHIHRTGAMRKDHTSGMVTIDSPIAADKGSFPGKKVVDEDSMDDVDEEIDVDDPSSWPPKARNMIHASSSSSSSFDIKLGDKEPVVTEGDREKGQSKVDSSSSSVGAGFAMKLARMMAGRYSDVCQNLALFCAFSLCIWSGQWIYFHFDVVKAAERNYNPYLAFWSSNLIWLKVVFSASFCLKESSCTCAPTGLPRSKTRTRM